MAKSNEEYSRLLAMMQAEKAHQEKVNAAQKQKVSSLYQTYNQTLAQTVSGSGGLGGINQMYRGGGAGYAVDDGWVGPFTSEQVQLLAQVMNIRNTQRRTLVNRISDVWYVQIGSEKTMSDTSKAEWQEGYDKGFEDGEKSKG